MKLKNVIIAAFATVLLISGCQSVDLGLPGSTPQTQDTTPTFPVKTGAANGEVIGSGPIRIALLLPKTAAGNGSKIAAEYKNAAMLAMEELDSRQVELVIKDTLGTPAGAIASTQEALKEGSSIILGPVFSGSVTSAASVTKLAKRTMIAFSTDPSAASPGVYLMSFLPDQIVARIANYLVDEGNRNFVAVIPNGAYGIVAERQLRETLSRKGATLSGISRYDYTTQSVVTAAKEIAEAAKTADVIFVPDGGAAPGAIAGALRGEGVDVTKKRFAGTGQWRTADLNSAYLQGGIFADMDESGLAGFEKRYMAKYQMKANLSASIGYDAVALVIGLINSAGPAGLTKRSLENTSGFKGVTGIFRFNADGKSERGLSIYQIKNGKASEIARPPSGFSARASLPFSQ